MQAELQVSQISSNHSLRLSFGDIESVYLSEARECKIEIVSRTLVLLPVKSTLFVF